jgi:hypothetical protein
MDVWQIRSLNKALCNDARVFAGTWHVMAVVAFVVAFQQTIFAQVPATRTATTPQIPSRLIVFCSSELEHLTTGGAGVVVADTARALYRAGWHVVIIVDMIGTTQAALDRWAGSARNAWKRQRDGASASLPFPGKISLSLLSDLVGGDGLSTPSSNQQQQQLKLPLPQLVWQKSIQWSLAMEPYMDIADAIEFLDCGGAAYHTLLARKKNDYLKRPPPKTQIWIRTHGMHQAIATGGAGGAKPDAAASVVQTSSPPPPPRAIMHNYMYTMETRALQMADVVIANSPGIAREYAHAYNLVDGQRVVVIPPTLGTLEDDITMGGTQHPAVPEYVRSPEYTNILVYGKLQFVKGPDIAAKAIVLAMRSLADTWKGSALFAGDDMPCDKDPAITMSQCILDTIPADLRPRFRFAGRVRRESLGQFATAERVRFAILPSRYETFCLAAHDAAYFGIQVILPRLPAYEGFFMDDGQNAIVFDRGSIDDLERAIKAALVTRVNSSVMLDRHVYNDPAETYMRLT